MASTAIARAPSFTPKALSANRKAYTPVSSSARAVVSENAGTSVATCSDSAAATPALEAMLLIHISAPARKPANEPKTAVRYVYGPPVARTRLPMAEKHSATGMIASAPARIASGAAMPICPPSADGMRKMPPPMITLMTAAVSAKVPTARISAASPSSGRVDGFDMVAPDGCERPQTRMHAVV